MSGVLENGLTLPRIGSMTFETYESNCAYVLRYMVDRDIVGCNWLTIPAAKWSPRTALRAKAPTASTRGRADAKRPGTVDAPPAGARRVVLRRLLARARRRVARHRSTAHPLLRHRVRRAARALPRAGERPVIQIANHVTLQGSTQPVVKNIFCLDECAPISGAQVLSFETEEDMLRSGTSSSIACDADIITGYNIVNFDLPYLLNRAAALKMKSFPYLGRIKGS